MKRSYIYFEFNEFEPGDRVMLLSNDYENELGRRGDEFVVRDFWEPDPGIGRAALVFLKGFQYGYSPRDFELIESISG